MKQVDIIRPSSINAIIGPVGTLKRMLKNQEYFNSRGYEVTVFANESLQIGPIKEPLAVPQAIATPPTSGLRRKLSAFLRMQAKRNQWIAKWYLERDKKKTELLIDYYLSLNRTPNIVEFHSNLECQIYLQKRKDKRAKTIMFLHSDGFPFKMTLQYYPCLERSQYLRKLKDDFSWTVANTDRIVFIAKIGQINFLSLYPNRSLADTSVIINGIDDLTPEQNNEGEKIRQSYQNSPFKYRLCCSGTINTRKGHRIIIEALHKLDESILQNIHVDFMGEGGELPLLESLVKEYGLEEHVKFWGMVPNIDIYKYLAMNNIYILMSKNEGLPISIIEAMRASLPIISTRVSGIPELVDEGRNGFLIEPSVDELLSLFLRLHEYDWNEMGCHSRHRFEKEFTFKRMKREFCDMFDLMK